VAAWQFELAGKTVRLDDVGIDEVESALEGTGVNWYDFERKPFESAKALVAFVKYLATDLGVDPPLPLTPAKLNGLVKLVDDDLPDTYTDGMPDPKVGDQTTG
jgi:hypothetical protein